MAERRRHRRPERVPHHNMENGNNMDPKQDNVAGSIVGTVVWALAIAFIFKSFLIDTFWIPSGSMEPTLEVGDFVAVTKWNYGYNRHSLMFDPPIFKGQQFWSTSPQRGDIVVFDATAEPPDRPGANLQKYYDLENGGRHIIKRIVGMPGDRVRLVNGLIEITTQSGDVKWFTREEATAQESQNESALATLFRETNPEGRSYLVREYRGETFGDSFDTQQGGWAGHFTDGVVPEGQVFVMGDNRDRSGDSRRSLRSIPIYKIVGRARVVVFSFNSDWLPRIDRIFRPLR